MPKQVALIDFAASTTSHKASRSAYAIETHNALRSATMATFCMPITRSSSIVTVPRPLQRCMHRSLRTVRGRPTPTLTTSCATLPRTSEGTVPVNDSKSVELPWAPEWRVSGASLDAGELPAVLYFTLSASHALDIAPYNDFTTALISNTSSGVRIFSTTLPFHGLDLQTNMRAFTEWQRVYMDGGDVVSRFARSAASFADEIVNRGLAPVGRVYAAGLSRGGLLAAHVAMQSSAVGAVVGFAPVVVLGDLPEFSDDALPTEAARARVRRASLLRTEALDALADIPVRFYAGNFDRRVGTRNAFELTHTLAQKAYEDHGVRSPPHEFIMYCSIGSEGHGTPSDVFRDGAQWVLEQATK